MSIRDSLNSVRATNAAKAVQQPTEGKSAATPKPAAKAARMMKCANKLVHNTNPALISNTRNMGTRK